MTPGEYIFIQGLAAFQPKGPKASGPFARWFQNNTPVLVLGFVLVFIGKCSVDVLAVYLNHQYLTK